MARLKTKHPNDTLYFIIGYDAFLHFTQWNDWPEVLNLVNLVVAKRPETEPENKTTRDLLEKCEVKAELVKSFSGGKICVMEINALDISSTEIRKKLKNSLNVTRILPITVYNFIQHEGIYAK